MTSKSDAISSKDQPAPGSSQHIESYSAALAKDFHVLEDQERQEITSRLEKVKIEIDIASVETIDIQKSATEVPYYKNFNQRVCSVIDNCPEDLRVLQDVNLLLIDKIPKMTVHRTDYSKFSGQSKTARSKGDTERALHLFSEFIYILRLRKDIDYENSTYKGMSDNLKWCMKFISREKYGAKQIPHIILSPDDHRTLGSILQVKDESLTYKAVMQTLALLSYHFHYLKEGNFGSILRELLTGSQPKIILNKNVSDLSNVEPFYIWTSVLSIDERKMLIKYFGDDFFKIQSKLFLDYKKKGSQGLVAETKLKELAKAVKDKLPVGIWSIIYGRIKYMREWRTSLKHREMFLSKNKDHIGQISYENFVKLMTESAKLDMLAEENISSVLLRLTERSVTIRDLTTHVHYDPVLKKQFYEFDSIKETVSLKQINRAALDGNKQAISFIKMIGAKTSGWKQSEIPKVVGGSRTTIGNTVDLDLDFGESSVPQSEEPVKQMFPALAKKPFIAASDPEFGKKFLEKRRAKQVEDSIKSTTIGEILSKRKKEQAVPPPQLSDPKGKGVAKFEEGSSTKKIMNISQKDYNDFILNSKLLAGSIEPNLTIKERQFLDNIFKKFENLESKIKGDLYSDYMDEDIRQVFLNILSSKDNLKTEVFEYIRSIFASYYQSEARMGASLEGSVQSLYESAVDTDLD